MVSPQLSHLLQRETASPADSGVSKSSLYSRTGYIEGESSHLPCDMNHSLGIAREEVQYIPTHCMMPHHNKIVSSHLMEI